MKALLELETGSDDLLSGDPKLTALSSLLSRLKTLAPPKLHPPPPPPRLRDLLLRCPVGGGGGGDEISASPAHRVRAPVVDRPPLHRPAALPELPRARRVNALDRPRVRLSQGYDRGFQSSSSGRRLLRRRDPAVGPELVEDRPGARPRRRSSPSPQRADLVDPEPIVDLLHATARSPGSSRSCRPSPNPRRGQRPGFGHGARDPPTTARKDADRRHDRPGPDRGADGAPEVVRPVGDRGGSGGAGVPVRRDGMSEVAAFQMEVGEAAAQSDERKLKRQVLRRVEGVDCGR
ncbi:uncharacterized protein A4U43_C03F31340 [Asparagus officinalis]|uniref:Uncharacterized protein n=1 Tax=Asparagus officinalis TaxID=4686 RepID=A0A5P1FF27_ASPOF|nr:uncharacterized protein A4U43_C03F31340 [Asparagus officinalis]